MEGCQALEEVGHFHIHGASIGRHDDGPRYGVVVCLEPWLPVVVLGFRISGKP